MYYIPKYYIYMYAGDVIPEGWTLIRDFNSQSFPGLKYIIKCDLNEYQTFIKKHPNFIKALCSSDEERRKTENRKGGSSL